MWLLWIPDTCIAETVLLPTKRNETMDEEIVEEMQHRKCFIKVIKVYFIGYQIYISWNQDVMKNKIIIKYIYDLDNR